MVACCDNLIRTYTVILGPSGQVSKFFHLYISCNSSHTVLGTGCHGHLLLWSQHHFCRRPSQVLSLAQHALGYLMRSSYALMSQIYDIDYYASHRLIHIPHANAIPAPRLRRCSAIRKAPASRTYLFSLIRARCSRTRSIPSQNSHPIYLPNARWICKFSRAPEFILRR